MDCSEVTELLSAYYDEELSSDKRAAVAEHLEACEDCARELGAFGRLSEMAEGLTHPEPPAHIWDQLEEQLDAERAERSKQPAVLGWLEWANKPAARWGLATAAMILIAVGWISYGTWFDHHDEGQLAADFAPYLEKFHHDPQAAQQILLAKFPGQVVDAEQAVQRVGYRPAVAGGLPPGYTAEAMYVMKMPCCTCVQCLCRRSDGTMLAIFEHDEEETKEWFGDQPARSMTCHNKRCRLVDLDHQMAASWKCGERYITVIGARDVAEVGELVAWFDDRRRGLAR